jgi:hypothetical protein
LSPSLNDSLAKRFGFGQVIAAPDLSTVYQDVMAAVAWYDLTVPSFFRFRLHRIIE